MSCPCAQVSISRAVTADGRLMAGPNQGTRSAGSRPAKTLSNRVRATANQSRRSSAPQSR